MDGQPLDLYEVAHLSGGRCRVVDTALVALVQRGRVRAQRSGELTVVDGPAAADQDALHQVERDVLALLGPAAPASLPTLCQAIAADPALAALEEQLRRRGLLATRRLAWVRRTSPTAAGRKALRESAPQTGTADRAIGDAWVVARAGLGELPDTDLRDALLGIDAPVTAGGGRRRGRGPDDSWGGSVWGVGDGSARHGGHSGGHGHGHGGGGHSGGGHSGGGHGCGGVSACGGGGCGGGGCGGGGCGGS